MDNVRRLILLSLLISCTYIGNSSAQVAKSSLERHIESIGYVDIQSLDPTIMVHLIYATADNFVGANMYGSELTHAYFLPHFAQKIVAAQTLLKSEKGDDYTLIIYDALRPLSVQKKMYDTVRGTPNVAYVSSPSGRNGRHNYGVAVDLSIYHIPAGRALDMGSEVDHFSELSHVGQEERMVKAGRMTSEAMHNRRYLIRLMNRVGLRPIRKEWWHFEERMPTSEVKRKYNILDL